MKNKYAYVTLLSSQDYLLALLVLNKSLCSVKSKYPLLVCITENLATETNLNILQKEHIQYKIISTLTYNANIDQILSSNLKNTASKIQIFSLKDYDKLVYLDCDSLILQNIDDLFNYPNGAMLHYSNEKKGMSGLFVINPKLHNEQFYIYLIQNYPNIVDGNLIGDLFFVAIDNQMYQIPEIYFINSSVIKKEYKGLHYGLGEEWKKPFLISSLKEILKYNQYPSYAKYFEYMIPLKKQYNL